MLAGSVVLVLLGQGPPATSARESPSPLWRHASDRTQRPLSGLDVLHRAVAASNALSVVQGAPDLRTSSILFGLRGVKVRASKETTRAALRATPRAVVFGWCIC